VLHYTRYPKPTTDDPCLTCAVCSGATSALPQRSSLICWKGWRANGLPVPVGAASLLHRRGRWKGAEFAPVL
jgi:hypothetical protein